MRRSSSPPLDLEEVRRRAAETPEGLRARECNHRWAEANCQLRDLQDERKKLFLRWVCCRDMSDSLWKELCPNPTDRDPSFDLETKIEEIIAEMRKLVPQLALSNDSKMTDSIIPLATKVLQWKELKANLKKKKKLRDQMDALTEKCDAQQKVVDELVNECNEADALRDRRHVNPYIYDDEALIF